MHPAFSVIFLTTLIGAGQGLFLALFTGQVYSVANLLPDQAGDRFYAAGSALALAFLLAGLVASVFHLGRPERAWRAATQWRTSWLSREVIALPLFMGLLALYALTHYLGWTGPIFQLSSELAVDASLIIGLLASLAAFTLYVCTAMIYASLKFLREWYSPLTVVNYTLLGLASGFMLAAAFSARVDTGLIAFFGTWAVIFTLAGLFFRSLSLLRNSRLRDKFGIASAIGIRHPKTTQLSQGFMGGSFNTREFFHGRTPAVIKLIRYSFLLLVFIIPVLIISVAYFSASTDLPLFAFMVQYVGLLAERWYFFAEARHPQNRYYQSMA